MMSPNSLLLAAALVGCLFLCHAVAAQSITVDKDEELEPKTFTLPFAFYNDSFDMAFAVAFASSGFPQKQASFGSTLIYGTNESYSFFVVGSDLQIPPLSRLFLDPLISVGEFGELDSYTDGNPRFSNERAGSNRSNRDNFIRAEGADTFVRLTLKYLLPIGHGRDTIINTYVLDRGLLHEGATGGESWNPWVSGRTYLEIEPFFRSQSFDSDELGTGEFETNGITGTIRYDNRDYHDNPSRGSTLRFAATRDWAKLGSDGPWTTLELEGSKYFSLGASDWFRQRVLALNAWTAYCPTWDSGFQTKHRPPLFAGATLGGLDRMRGFPSARFSDQSAVYYAAELRLIPEWNPLGEDSWLSFLEIDWIQFVPFTELGRVSDAYRFNELHSDMKWDVGLGLRAMVNRLVIRIDTAVSDEAVGVQMMLEHPF